MHIYELTSCLLFVEQKYKLLMKNHKVCPIGSSPFLEVNAAIYDYTCVVVMLVLLLMVMDMVIEKKI